MSGTVERIVIDVDLAIEDNVCVTAMELLRQEAIRQGFDTVADIRYETSHYRSEGQIIANVVASGTPRKLTCTILCNSS